MFVCLFVCVISYCCKSQSKNVNIREKDILVFNFEINDCIKGINPIERISIPGKGEFNIQTNNLYEFYKKNKMIIMFQEWDNDQMSPSRFSKKYSFVRQKDTMTIKSRCGQERNYYFKNLIFQKRNYELSLKETNEKKLGKKIKTLKEIQDILFKGAYVSDKKPIFQDVYFKDIEFYEINLRDTINVRLARIE